MLLNVCKKLNISLLGYDENNKSFVRFTPDRTKRQYKAIVYQMALGHFYIITDTNIINSLTASLSDTFFKDLTIENTEEEKQKLKTLQAKFGMSNEQVEAIARQVAAEKKSAS
jgi:hypothetical protein